MAEQTVTAQEARIKAEHIILEGKPFAMTWLEADGNSSMLIYVGDENLPKEERGTNRKRLDLSIMCMTNQVHPEIKIMWVLMDMQNKMKGDNNEEG